MHAKATLPRRGAPRITAQSSHRHHDIIIIIRIIHIIHISLIMLPLHHPYLLAGELLASYRGHTHTGVKMGCALMPSDAFVVGASEDGEWGTLNPNPYIIMGLHQHGEEVVRASEGIMILSVSRVPTGTAQT